MLFIFQDPPNSPQTQAKEFAFAEVRRAEQRLQLAKAALEAAENEAEATDQLTTAGGTNYWDDPNARRVDHIEQLLSKAENELRAALNKLNWEGNRQFARTIPRHPKAMPTPWKDEPNDWLKNFKRRVA